MKSEIFRKAIAVMTHETQTDLLILQSKIRLLQNQHKISDDDLSDCFSAIKNIYLYNDMTYMNFLDKTEDWVEMFPLEIIDVHRAIGEMLANFSLYQNHLKKIIVQKDNSFNVKINKVLFSNVIHNILKNALFFSSANNENNVSIKTDVSDKRYNRIIISNNGPEIPEHYIANIFKPYYTSRINGFGMGLYFAKNAVHFMNGSLEFANASSGDVFGEVNKTKIDNVNFVISFSKNIN